MYRNRVRQNQSSSGNPTASDSTRFESQHSNHVVSHDIRLSSTRNAKLAYPEQVPAFLGSQPPAQPMYIWHLVFASAQTFLKVAVSL